MIRASYPDAGCSSNSVFSSTPLWPWPWPFLLSGICSRPVKRKGAYNSWISLGAIDQFPAGETRLATIRIPSPIPGMGRRPRLPAGCAASTRKIFRSSPSTARTWAAQSAGSRNRACSCAPATAAPITPTDREPRDRPSADSSSTNTKLRATSYRSVPDKRPRLPPKPATVCVCSITTKDAAHALAKANLQLV